MKIFMRYLVLNYEKFSNIIIVVIINLKLLIIRILIDLIIILKTICISIYLVYLNIV